VSALPKPYITPERYLEIERAAEFKSEYDRGEMFAMAGTSRAHNGIVFNVVGELREQFRGRPCQGFSNDMLFE
jgi:Uma2 family endonuclease